nr:retrovirus-related Pol polyprotein from transposon TNT 1-94 [Tanacetum cinerariifolium]
MYSPQQTISQIDYPPEVNIQQQSEFSQFDLGLTVLVFKHDDDHIDAINHMMSFMYVVVTSRFPTTNNQLRNSSNPHQQVTIHDGRVKYNLFRGDIFLMLLRKRDDSWFKDKVLLVQAQANGHILHDEELQFLAVLGIPKGQATQSVIIHNTAYQADDLDAYDSNCDELNTARIALMANLSHFGSDALAEEAVHNSTPYAQQDALTLSVIEQLRTQVMNCTKVNLDNKSVNDTLTAELERYKEQVKFLKEGKSFDFMHRVTISDSCEQSVEIDHFKQTLSEQKARQLEPKLYDGDVIQTNYAIVISDSEETLLLAEESHPIPSNRATIVEVPNELPKVSMATDQHRLESKTLGFQNERLLEQVISKDIVNIVVNDSVNNAFVSMSECKKCLKLKNEILNKQDFIEKEKYDKLLSSYTTLEKHCISLEFDTQLNQENIKRDKSISNQSALSFNQYFELNELKSQSQEKDTVIKKLKGRVESLSGNVDNDKVKKDIDEIETINIELEHRVSKLVAENEHLKQTYKQLYDSIKPTRIQSTEQCVALINQVNLKSVKISDLNVSFQEQALIITTLKEELRKLKAKAVAKNAVTLPIIAPKMYDIDVQPIPSRLLHNRMVHSEYLKYTKEQDVTLREIVKQGKSQNRLNSSLDYACMYAKRIQELLIIIRQTCPSINKSSANLVAMNLKSKDKKVRFLSPPHHLETRTQNPLLL